VKQHNPKYSKDETKRKSTKRQTMIYKRVHFMQCSTKLTCIFLTLYIKFKCCNDLWIFYLYEINLCYIIMLTHLNLKKIKIKLFCSFCCPTGVGSSINNKE
jgi:Fe2+ transport system protein B